LEGERSLSVAAPASAQLMQRLDKQLIKCLQVELNPLFRHDFPRFCVQGNLRPGRCYRVKTGQAYIGTKPSKKRVLKLCESISQKTQREANGRDTEEMIEQLNLMLKGWPTIFGLVRCAKPMKAWTRADEQSPQAENADAFFVQYPPLPPPRLAVDKITQLCFD